MSFPRRRESILCISFSIFFFSLSLRTCQRQVWQSHYSFISFIFIYLLLLTHILQLLFCISFYFFIISSLAYNPNPLLLYKLNTKYQRLTTDFNNYPLFLYAILHFSSYKNYKKTIIIIYITIFTL